MEKRNDVMITIPGTKAKGGVAQYYRSVLPYLQETVTPLEIGKTRGSFGFLHPIVDQIRFRSALKQFTPSLVQLNPSLNLKSLLRDGAFVWQAKRSGYPVLVFFRGWDDTFEKKWMGKYFWYFRKTIGQADGVIVLASHFKACLRQWGVQAPIFLETTSVDDRMLDGVDVQKKWQNVEQVKEIKILFLARLEREKGAFETIEAVKILLEQSLPVHLTVSGDGKIKQELQNFAKELGIAEQRINFTGDIRGKDKQRALQSHHLYCFPTYYGEGMPNSVLEAMAFGMPVVTRGVGGLADFFENEKMGYLVKDRSPDSIATCLKAIVSDKHKMSEMGNYNAEYAKKNFMAQVVANRLQAIHNTIIEKGPCAE